MMVSFPCDQLIFQGSYLPQTSPSGSFINTSAVINESEMGFSSFFFRRVFSFSCSGQCPDPSTRSHRQAWWENGFPDGSEFQTGLNVFSPSAFTVFYLHLIQLSSEQRVIVFFFPFFFVAIPDSFVLSWLHYKMIIICECSDPVNTAWCDWSRWKVVSAPGSDSWQLLLELLMLVT